MTTPDLYLQGAKLVKGGAADFSVFSGLKNNSLTMSCKKKFFSLALQSRSRLRGLLVVPAIALRKTVNFGILMLPF